jgi:hypothetical protein
VVLGVTGCLACNLNEDLAGGRATHSAETTPLSISRGPAPVPLVPGFCLAIGSHFFLKNPLP